jgi:tRNA-specific adenosine deaminase 1
MQHSTQPTDTAIKNDVVTAAFAQYASLLWAPQPGKHTVLAGFALHDAQSGHTHLISLGAGAKCLPANRLPTHGDALHDSHAEVIARRGAVRWLLEEAQRTATAHARGSTTTTTSSLCQWLSARSSGGRLVFALRDGVHLWMYASTVPCNVHHSPLPPPDSLI